MFRVRLAAGMAIILMILMVQPAGAAQAPDLIRLPVGFQPEGMAVGRGSTFFTGSRADGRVLRGDLLTGDTSVLVAAQAGTASLGMAYDSRSDSLFVAGGQTGVARVFNASTGELKQTYTLAAQGKFINDVVITNDAAYFTNSTDPLIYRLPLGPAGGLPDPNDVQTLTLGGDWAQGAGFNANGIEATSDGKWLVVVNSVIGSLYRVDPLTGTAKAIDLGGQSVSDGDGLRFKGSLLYVARNTDNEIVAVDLSKDLTSGTVVDTLIDPRFDVITTMGVFVDSLYIVNAKFTAADPTAIPYEILKVELK